MFLVFKKLLTPSMMLSIHPKLPMRNKTASKAYYITQLGFNEPGNSDYEDYLILQKDGTELHFFLFKELDPRENYGQVYIRCKDIEQVYQSLIDNKVAIHPNGQLQARPWGQKEFHLLDPDNNLLTFGETVL